jgi:hypothetical protein
MISGPLQLSSQVSGFPPAGWVWRISTTRSLSVSSFFHSMSSARAGKIRAPRRMNVVTRVILSGRGDHIERRATPTPAKLKG